MVLKDVLPFVLDDKVRIFLRNVGLSIMLSSLRVVLANKESSKPKALNDMQEKLTMVLTKHLQSTGVRPNFLSEILQALVMLRSSQPKIEFGSEEIVAIKLAALEKTVKSKLSKQGRKALNKLVKCEIETPKQKHDPKSDEAEISATEAKKPQKERKSKLKLNNSKRAADFLTKPIEA